MGNKWELQDIEKTLIEVCPCGKGGYYKIYKEYKDDYLRNHFTNEYSVECNQCNGKYEYYKQRWITIEHYEIIRNREQTISQLKNKLYIDLFSRHFRNILLRFNSKKSLYEFCCANRIFRMPGTLSTFYRNGLEHYFSVQYSIANIDDFLVLMKYASIELSKDEIKTLQEIKDEMKSVSNLLFEYSVT